MRLLGNAPVLLALLLPAAALAGCGSDDEDRAAVEAVAAQADAADAGVLRELPEVLGLGEPSGSRSFTTCGEPAAPRGVVLQEFVNFTATGAVDAAASRTAAVGVLEDAGWEVADPDHPVAVSGTKDELTLRVEVAASVAVVSLVSACIETSSDVARQYAGRAPIDVPDSPR